MTATSCDSNATGLRYRVKALRLRTRVLLRDLPSSCDSASLFRLAVPFRCLSFGCLSMSSLSVYLDADVLIAGAASPNAHSAAQVVLTLCEITLLDAITSTLAVTECRRNIEAKFDRAGEVRAQFDDLIARAVDVVEAPSPEQVRQHEPYAHWKDVPHLASAAQHRCRYLVTYNVADYNVADSHVEDSNVADHGVADPKAEDVQKEAQPLAALHVIRPGPLVRTVRAQLAGL